MPHRRRAAQELEQVLKALAHADRIRIVEALRRRERDVTEIHMLLELPATRVSQHLAILKSHRIVKERREGRRHFYNLAQPRLADWLIEALDILDARAGEEQRASSAIRLAKRSWKAGAARTATPPRPTAEPSEPRSKTP